MCVVLDEGSDNPKEDCTKRPRYEPGQKLVFHQMTQIELVETVHIKFSSSSDASIADLKVNYQVHSGLFPSIFSNFTKFV